MHFTDFGHRLLKHVGERMEMTQSRILGGLPDWTAYKEQLARLNELREMDQNIRSILGRDEPR